MDMVFNIAEGKHGRFRESEVLAVLDYLNIPYTGSDTFSLALGVKQGFDQENTGKLRISLLLISNFYQR